MSGSGVTAAGDINSRREFARYGYENLQAIIRQLDIKAGAFITLLIILTTGALPWLKEVSAKLQWDGRGAITSWIYAVSLASVVLGLLATAACLHRVIRPRGSIHKTVTKGLMFAEDIIQHETPDKYYEAIRTCSEETFCHTLSSEMFQLSAIIIAKKEALGVALWPTTFSFIAWAVNTLAAAYILTWK